jgi:hypothetical protein
MPCNNCVWCRHRSTYEECEKCQLRIAADEERIEIPCQNCAFCPSCSDWQECVDCMRECFSFPLWFRYFHRADKYDKLSESDYSFQPRTQRKISDKKFARKHEQYASKEVKPSKPLLSTTKKADNLATTPSLDVQADAKKAMQTDAKKEMQANAKKARRVNAKFLSKVKSRRIFIKETPFSWRHPSSVFDASDSDSENWYTHADALIYDID